MGKPEIWAARIHLVPVVLGQLSINDDGLS